MPAKPAVSESTNTPILIKAYGEFWNPDLVNWNHSKRLLGIGPKQRTIDVYEQRGIYVLYENYIPVYAGKADKESLGSRLQNTDYLSAKDLAGIDFLGSVLSGSIKTGARTN